MHELANKVEERLMELENFPWQNRPNSSCSAAGDDISVRYVSSSQIDACMKICASKN